jgi:hypothetical protein
MVGVAQLVRAPDCGSGGRGFETRHPPHTVFSSFTTELVDQTASLKSHQTNREDRQPVLDRWPLLRRAGRWSDFRRVLMIGNWPWWDVRAFEFFQDVLFDSVRFLDSVFPLQRT